MKSLSPEEAIVILSDMKIDIQLPKAAVLQRKRNAALDMAISALSCSEIPNSSDSISRQAAIDALMNEASHDGAYGYISKQDIVKVLNALPSAQPERKKGEWINLNHDNCYKCSSCGDTWMGIGGYNYCPNCGADMREVDDERPD